MTQPTHIRAIDPDDDSATVDAIEQHVWRAHSHGQGRDLARVLQADGRGLTMVFCRTKRNAPAGRPTTSNDRGFAAAAVHGDLGQGAREQALRAFRNGKVDVLVATDVAARGIDVDDVTHVINYQCPEDEKTYLHRIGRTGRAGKTGVAVTFVDWDDLHRWRLINQALGLAVRRADRDLLLERRTSTPTSTSPRAPRAACPRPARTREGLDAEEIEDLGETGAAAGKRNKSRTDDKHDKHDRHHKDKHDHKDGKGGGSRGSDEPRAPREPRQPRERKRTRGNGAAPAAAGEGSTATVTVGADVAAPATGPESDLTADGGAPRRRRRRGGRGRGRTGEGASTEPAPAAANDD